jgi:flagellar protein FlgJ
MQAWMVIVLGVVVGVSMLRQRQVANVRDALTREEFVRMLMPIAKTYGKKKNYNYRFIITQAALESNWGNSRLARDANNLFGITAGKTWTGETYRIETTEYMPLPTRVVRDFRRYRNWEESVKDYFDLMQLQMPQTYRRVMQAGAGEDVYAWAEAVWLSGYATDPRYRDKLIEVYRAIRWD